MADQERNVIVRGQFQDKLTPGLQRASKAAQQLDRALTKLGSAAKGGAGDVGQATASFSRMEGEARKLDRSLSTVQRTSSRASRSLKDVGDGGRTAASGMGTATTQVGALQGKLAVLNQALQVGRGGLGSVAQAAATGGVAITGVGAAAAAAAVAVGLLVTAAQELGQQLGEAVGAYAADEKAQVRLEALLRVNVGNYDRYARAIDRAVEQAERLGYADDDVRASLSATLPMTRNVSRSLDVLSAAYDMAAATGLSVEEASEGIARGMEGQTRVLRRYIPDIGEAKTATEVLAKVTAAYGGVAKEMADTTAGAVARLVVQLGELQEAVGKPMAGPLTETVQGLEGLTQALQLLVVEGSPAGELLKGLGGIIRDTVLGPVRDLVQDLGLLNAIFGFTAEDAEKAAEKAKEAGAETGRLGTTLADAAALASGAGDEGEEALGRMGEAATGAADAAEESFGRMGEAASGGASEVSQSARDVAVAMEGSLIQALLDAGDASEEEYLRMGEAAVGHTVTAGLERDELIEILATYETALAGTEIYVQDTTLAWSTAFTAARQAIEREIALVKAALKQIGGQDIESFRSGVVGEGRKQEAATDWSILNPDRSRDDIEGIRSGAGRNTVPAAQEAANRRMTRERYEGLYGRSPDDYSPVKAPKGKKGKSPEQLANEAERAADRLERAQERLAAAQQAIEYLEQDKQLELHQAEVTHLKDGAQDQADFWDGVIEGLRDDLDRLEDEQRDFLAPMREELAQAEGDLKRFRERSEEALHGMDVELRKLNIQMRELRKEAASALAPFEASVAAATEKLRSIQEESRRTAHEFELLLRPLQDALYELGIAERDALAPIEAALKAQSERVAELRGEVDSTAESYDKLLRPLHKRLEEITHAQEKLNRAQELGKMGMAVGNLQARLKNAAAGSREATSLAKDLANAQAELNLKTEEYSLSDQIRDTELAKEAAVSLAEERAAAAERELELLEKQRVAVVESYAAQREAIERQIELLQRQEELRQREIADRAYAAQDELTQAEAALTAEQRKWAAKEANLQAEIDKLSEIREQRAFDDAESERLQVKEINRIKDRITFWEGVYGTKKQGLQDEIDYYEGLKEDDLETINGVLEGAQARLETLQAAIDAARQSDRESAAQADLVAAKAELAEAQANVIATAHATLKDAVPLTDDAKTKTDDAKTAAQGLATALNTELAPAITGMTTATGPELDAFWTLWQKYFGVEKASAETGKILWLMSNRNPEGLFAKLITAANLALGVDGYRGTWNNRLNEVFADVSAKLDTETVSATTKGTAIGGGLIDGMTAGAEDLLKIAALEQAVKDAVDKAVAAGVAQAEAHSPSERAARELGEPLPEGMAVGVARATEHVEDAMRTMMDSAFVAASASRGAGLLSGLLSGVLAGGGPPGASTSDVRIPPGALVDAVTTRRSGFAPFGGSRGLGFGGMGVGMGAFAPAGMAFAPPGGGDGYTHNGDTIYNVKVPPGTELPTTPQGWMRVMKPLDEAVRMYHGQRGRSRPGRPVSGAGGRRGG